MLSIGEKWFFLWNNNTWAEGMLHSGCVALVKPFAITHPAAEIWHFCFLMMLAIIGILQNLFTSLRKAFLSLLAVLWNFTFRWVCLCFSPLPVASLLFSAICKASSNNYFTFFTFLSWGWFWSLPPVQCYEPLSIVLQAFCLSDLIPWIYLSPPVYNEKGFDLG